MTIKTNIFNIRLINLNEHKQGGNMKYYFEKYSVEILDNGNTVFVTVFELKSKIFNFDPMDAYADTDILDLINKTYKNGYFFN